jgi:DNA-binding MarR family transcriptional regulator
MSNELQNELKQRRPFPSLAEEAFLNLSRTEAVLKDRLEAVLKRAGITGAQYNVLRILRGAEDQQLCRNEIRDRLVTRMPDVSRLLDRMEEAGLIVRARDSEDRRLVATRLTEAGRALVDELDGPIAEEHERQMGRLSESELKTLIELLTIVRKAK